VSCWAARARGQTWLSDGISDRGYRQAAASQNVAKLRDGVGRLTGGDVCFAAQNMIVKIESIFIGLGGREGLNYRIRQGLFSRSAAFSARRRRPMLNNGAKISVVSSLRDLR
jgi:hypothetical protein